MSTPDPNVRISNTEREAVLRRLETATEEGRLELDEFAERSRQVYEAKTYAEVERLLADLPEDSRGVAIANRSRPNRTVRELDLSPRHSKVTREGPWTVPSRITVKPKHARVVLDFREAEFTVNEVEIEARLTHSGLTIILPEGGAAVDDGLDFVGGRLKNKSRGRGPGPLIRLTGGLRHSTIKVCYERRFLWWRW